MTQVNDCSTESDETFQREVLERFDANEPPADSALRDELAAWLHEQYGQHTQPNSQRVDSLLAVFTAHLGQQQAAIADLVEHIARMADDWAEMGPGDQRNRELWAPLHRKADVLRDLTPGQELR